MSSFNVILLKNFFQQIPYELEESAALDGCSQMRILFKIILPLAMPGVVTVGLFYAVAQWNSYFPAMLYLRDRSLIPIQIILRDIVIQSQTTDLANFGIEGLTYTMVDGEPRYTDVIAKDTQGRSILSMLNVYGHREWAYQQDIRYEDALLDYNKEYIDYRNGMEKYIRPTIPALSFTEEERDVINNIYMEIQTYKDEMINKFIMGKESLDKFDVFVETIKDMGIDKVLEVYQAAYDRYMK